MDAVTLVYYELGGSAVRRRGFEHRTLDKDFADRGASSYETIAHTYRVGQSVQVEVHCRWKAGTVVALDDQRVLVEYVNGAGERISRNFTALHVRPVSNPGDRRHTHRR